jgi:hypothetical protein
LAKVWRPVAALTAILTVAVFVGVVVGEVSLLGSRTATSPQPERGAINPPVVRDTGDNTSYVAGGSDSSAAGTSMRPIRPTRRRR